jgi:hypothetical protein
MCLHAGVNNLEVVPVFFFGGGGICTYLLYSFDYLVIIEFTVRYELNMYV